MKLSRFVSFSTIFSTKYAENVQKGPKTLYSHKT